MKHTFYEVFKKICNTLRKLHNCCLCKYFFCKISKMFSDNMVILTIWDLLFWFFLQQKELALNLFKLKGGGGSLCNLTLFLLMFFLNRFDWFAGDDFIAEYFSFYWSCCCCCCWWSWNIIYPWTIVVTARDPKI